MSAIAPNSLIAITGLSGYIGSYCGLTALQAGYRVRGTVRSLKRGETIKQAYVRAGIQNIDGRLEIVVVDDLDSMEQYRNAFEGVDGIIHTALDWEKYGQLGFLDIPINNTQSMLQAAKLVSSVKRIVYTSSIVATIRQGTYRDKILTEKDWNDESPNTVAEDVAAGRTPGPMTIYAAAKIRAEKAAWEFMEKEKPHFDLVCLLVGACAGPWLHEAPPSSTAWVARMFNGGTFQARNIPLAWHIDIRDCARIHVESLHTPSLGGQRLLAINEPHGLNQVLAILRKRFPNIDTISPDFEPSVGYTWAPEMDNGPGKELIGGFIGLEQSVVDVGRCLGY